MVIRAITAADIPAIVEILTAAFWNEDAIGRFMHPRRDEFPYDVKKYWRHKIRVDYLDYRHTFMVAVDESTDKVVGVADWMRMGKKHEGGLWREWGLFSI
jgi:L-amino acid N-acyltransferase YncA